VILLELSLDVHSSLGSDVVHDGAQGVIGNRVLPGVEVDTYDVGQHSHSLGRINHAPRSAVCDFVIANWTIIALDCTIVKLMLLDSNPNRDTTL